MKKSLSIVVASLFLATQSLAGTVYDLVTTEANGGQSNEKLFVEDGNLRMEMSEDDSDNVTLLYKADTAAVIAVNHPQKNYMVMDKATIDEISVQMAAIQKQMDEMFKNMPPEQRAMMEKTMPGKMPQLGGPSPKIDIVKLGDGGKVNGFATVQYQLKYNGQPKQNLWVADWSQIEGGDDLKKSVLPMVELMQSLLSSMPMMADNMENPFEALSEIDGYPIRTQQLDDEGQVQSVTDLLSVKSQNLDAEMFQVPAGYQKQAMPKLN